MADRDGIFNALLLLEAVKSFNLKPSQLIEKLHKEFGAFYYDRIDMHIPSTEVGISFVEKIKSKPPEEINGIKVKEIKTLDGTKLIFEDESWLLFRASGTEALLRIYAEGKSKEFVSSMLLNGKKLFESSLKIAC